MTANNHSTRTIVPRHEWQLYERRNGQQQLARRVVIQRVCPRPHGHLVEAWSERLAWLLIGAALFGVLLIVYGLLGR